jgi:hypothetical protein
VAVLRRAAGGIKKMNGRIETMDNTVVERLLADFNEVLRCQGRANFGFLERCPPDYRKELLALMNVAVLAYRALEPERAAQRLTATVGTEAMAS